MHRFNVSAETFSKLWSLRRDAEQTEDQILRRLLDCPPEATAAPGAPGARTGGLDQGPDTVSGGDFIDATYGIRFAEGDRIFRTYKGRPYSARVVGGRWLLEGDGNGDTGPHARLHDSLNQLSQAVIDGNENAWMFWFIRRPDGTGKRIAELRDPALVQKRPRRKRRREWVARPETVPVPESTAASRKPLAPPSSTSTPPAKPGGGKAWEPKTKPD